MISSQLQPRMPGFNKILNLGDTKGWPYIATWAHRITGVFLVVYLVFHVLTLSTLHTPEKFVAKMATFSRFFPGFLEWFLAFPVIYHSLNGGRLILYEIFGQRHDKTVLKYVLLLSFFYLFLLAVFMINGNQTVSPVLFWSHVAVGSGCLAFLTIDKLRQSRASIFWKLQRISAAYLFIMIPAHMLFMHLNPTIGRDVVIITERMSSVFMKFIDSGLVISALYHGCYGVVTICSDYISSHKIRLAVSTAVCFGAIILATVGIKLTLFI